MGFFVRVVLAVAFLSGLMPTITPAALAETVTDEYQACKSKPKGGRSARKERQGSVVMTFALLLEKQGRDKPIPEYTNDVEPCVAETFDLGDQSISMITPGFNKGAQTLYYLILVQDGEKTREILILYNAIVSIMNSGGLYFSVSETQGAATSFYEVYKDRPTHKTLKKLVRDILQGKAKPLMSAEWQEGEPELVITAYDFDRLK